MSYETLMYASIGAGIVLLTISIIFFVYYKIPNVVSDLTGRTAKREIEAMKSAGRVTGKIRTRNIAGKKDKSTDELSKTNGVGWLVRNKRKKTTQLPEEDNGTEVRKTTASPEIMSKSEPVFQKAMSNGTVPLSNTSMGTVPLSNMAAGTMPLMRTEPPDIIPAGTELLQMPGEGISVENTGFVIRQRVLVIHTEEQI